MRTLAALALLSLAGCQKQEPTARDRLKPCGIDDGPTDAFCGTLDVFEDRAARSGRKIPLKIVLLPALRRDPKPDPLFALAGGPGQGAASIAQMFGRIFRRAQADRDVVLVDQRGTGKSNGMFCEPPDRDSDDLSKAGQEFDPGLFRKCLAELKAEPKLYTTSLAMDDLDDVRRHLGYGAINVWGGSYGTRAALVYLRQHTSSVRTVILDGVAPPDMKLPVYMARDGQRALNLLVADCDKEPACRKRFPNLGQSINTILDRAAARPKLRLTHPRTGETGDMTLNRELAASILFSTLYNPSIAALIPKVIEDASAGNFQPLLALAFIQEGGNRETRMSQGMFFSVVCAEDMPAITPAAIEENTRGTFFGRTMFDSRMKVCDFWPRAAVEPAYRDPVKSDKPVLILSGELDPVTPPSWGEHVARHLSNSRHIVVPGAGHGVTFSGCVPRLITRFLDEASHKGLDPACVQRLRRPPFFVNYSGPAGEAKQ